MRKSWKRAVIAFTAMGTVVGFSGIATPAQAAPGAIIAAAGSDTTEEFMDTILLNPAGDYNISAAPGNPETVPDDGAACGAITYDDGTLDPGETLAPNGSSAGINALIASDAAGNGCIDIARSSRSPNTAGADLNFWAYAKDFVSWASPSPNAPATLSKLELEGIFRTCTITNWDQVGGRTAPILAFAPQSSSGTFSFFRDKVLGGAYGACVLQAAVAPLIQENSCSSDPVVSNNNFINSVTLYSAGQWALQHVRKASPNLDPRNSCIIGGIEADPDGPGAGTTTCGLAADFVPLTYSGGTTRSYSLVATVSTNAAADSNNPAGVTNTGCGVRNVFNVTANGSLQQAAAEGLVGAASPLCNSLRLSQIAGAKFLPRATSGASCLLITGNS